MFQCFDRVLYVGEKLASQLHSKVGEVVARVKNAPTEYVVEFGDDAFVVNESSLRRYVPAKDEKEPEVRRRRRYDEDEA